MRGRFALKSKVDIDARMTFGQMNVSNVTDVHAMHPHGASDLEPLRIIDKGVKSHRSTQYAYAFLEVHHHDHQNRQCKNDHEADFDFRPCKPGSAIHKLSPLRPSPRGGCMAGSLSRSGSRKSRTMGSVVCRSSAAVPSKTTRVSWIIKIRSAMRSAVSR